MFQTLSERSIEWMRKIPLANVVHKKKKWHREVLRKISLQLVLTFSTTAGNSVQVNREFNKVPYFFNSFGMNFVLLKTANYIHKSLKLLEINLRLSTPCSNNVIKQYLIFFSVPTQSSHSSPNETFLVTTGKLSFNFGNRLSLLCSKV